MYCCNFKINAFYDAYNMYLTLAEECKENHSNAADFVTINHHIAYGFFEVKEQIYYKWNYPK